MAIETQAVFFMMTSFVDRNEYCLFIERQASLLGISDKTAKTIVNCWFVFRV